MFKFLVLFFAVVTLAVAQNSTWAVVDNNYETIALGLSFPMANTGWVAGGTASATPLLLYTTDGGVTFTNENLQGSSAAAYLDVGISSDGTEGIVGGLGFFGFFSCGATLTSNNTVWESIPAELICAYSNTGVVQSGVYQMTGTWVDAFDFLGNGVRFTINGGQSWTENNWDQKTPSGAYSVPTGSSFVSPTVGYTVGGSYPTTTTDVNNLDNLLYNQAFSYSRYLQAVHKDGKVSLEFTHPNEVSNADVYSDYFGVIAKATGDSSGKLSFNTVVNATNMGIYFQSIYCYDENTCWATANGVDSLAADIGQIWATTDGWNTYTIQVNVVGGNINSVEFLTATDGWAAGATVSSSGTIIGSFWETTDGGNTWNLEGTLSNFFAYEISIADSTHAYSSGFSPIGLSSFASYSPDN